MGKTKKKKIDVVTLMKKHAREDMEVKPTRVFKEKKRKYKNKFDYEDDDE